MESSKSLAIPASHFTLYLVQLISAVTLVTVVSNQAQYGPTNVCLLFVNNYHLEGDTFVFWARSSACSNLIALGAGSISVTIVLTGISFYFRNASQSKYLSLLKGLVSLVMAILSLAGGIAFAIGIAQSCRELEGINTASCSTIFSGGFYHHMDFSVIYEKSLEIVYLGVVASWIMFASYLTYSGLELYSYRYYSAKWW